MKLTAAQRKRLDMLATYLEALPADYSHFDMRWYIINADTEAEAKYARENGGVASCGTTACAVGHGPAAGILVPPRFFNGPGELHAVNWDDYCTLFIGDSQECMNWCFGGAWRGADNHHHGAAARIRYLLDHGQPPAEFWHPSSEWLATYQHYRIDAAGSDTHSKETTA